jgi:hypothetical protein
VLKAPTRTDPNPAGAGDRRGAPWRRRNRREVLLQCDRCHAIATGRTGRRGLAFGGLAGTTGDSLPASIEDARHEWAMAIEAGRDEDEARERFLRLQRIDRETRFGQPTHTRRGDGKLCGGRLRVLDIRSTT